jgi:hypothetical protein
VLTGYESAAPTRPGATGGPAPRWRQRVAGYMRALADRLDRGD